MAFLVGASPRGTDPRGEPGCPQGLPPALPHLLDPTRVPRGCPEASATAGWLSPARNRSERHLLCSGLCSAREGPMWQRTGESLWSAPQTAARFPNPSPTPPRCTRPGPCRGCESFCPLTPDTPLVPQKAVLWHSMQGLGGLYQEENRALTLGTVGQSVTRTLNIHPTHSPSAPGHMGARLGFRGDTPCWSPRGCPATSAPPAEPVRGPCGHRSQAGVSKNHVPFICF